jgi:hypothetical protein
MRPEAGFAGREAKPRSLLRAQKEGARGGTKGSPTSMPGEGLEPSWPEGHPGLSRARLTDSATPAEL